MFKIKVPVKFSSPIAKFESHGDWIDLRSIESVEYKGPVVENDIVVYNTVFVSLGIAMQLPKGFEANIVPRSSTFSKFGLIQNNHYGVIDHEYCGNNDIWRFGGTALGDGKINAGDRICQFRLNLSQRATFWQKLKWMLCKVEFVEVDNLEGSDRGGFGSTGV